MSGEAEVLDAGRPPRSRARLAAIVVVLLVLGVGAVLLDRSFRTRGAEQVAACRQEGASEMAAAFDRLTARTGTVRPAVVGMADSDLRRQLLGLVSDAVAGADDRLRAARLRCEEVVVLWHHEDLARQRDGCVATLQEVTAWFEAVSRDGGHAFGDSVAGGRGCR